MRRYFVNVLDAVARRGTRTLAVDVLLGVLLVVAGQLEVWLGPADAFPKEVLIAFLGTAPAVLWRRRPVLALVAVLMPLWILTAQRTDIFVVAHLLAMMLTTYAVALLCTRSAALAGLVLALGSALGNSAALATSTAGDFVFPLILLGVPWAAGRSLRLWRERNLELESLTASLTAQRQESARLAVIAERGKIARDLHDSLAQSLHVVVIHAEAAEEALGTDPGRARESLHRIQSVGRESLTETRQMLGVLRSPHEGSDVVVQPKLADLDRLVTSVRAAGLEVDLRIEGSARALPVSVDMSAYRIIQESLTNVLKHAQAKAARVVVRYDVDVLDLEIVDDGRGGGSDADANGYGLLGMRERSVILGGSLTAQPRTTGGFGVHARLPLERIPE